FTSTLCLSPSFSFSLSHFFPILFHSLLHNQHYLHLQYKTPPCHRCLLPHRTKPLRSHRGNDVKKLERNVNEQEQNSETEILHKKV
ncbi:hypothetical protein Tsubulata_050977, partial [Turnera subulata]